jgi:calcineurin-like phosphoesterase family protein
MKPEDLDDKGRWKALHIAKKRALQMDDDMIELWNNTVDPEDVVYHLGDFCMGNQAEYKRRLNGEIFFLRGNHDRQVNFKLFTWVENMKQISVNDPDIGIIDQEVTLCHYAMRVWNKSHHGAWHLYGHSHGTLPDDPNALSMDVGVDCHGYRPIDLAAVKKHMEKKAFKPIDHHGE